MIRCLLIEDEPISAKLLQTFVNKNFTDVQIVAHATNISQAYELERMYTPDVVFLDLHLPDGTGFDFLNKYVIRPFEVIFVTGELYPAKLVFDYRPIDYLSKRIDLQQLRRAMERLRMVLKQKQENISALPQKENNTDMGKMMFKTIDGIVLVEIHRVVFIQAQRSYCTIHNTNNIATTVSQSMSKVAEKLDPYWFTRSDKSHLVARRHIKNLTIHGVKMSTGVIVPISRRQRPEFMEWLQKTN